MFGSPASLSLSENFSRPLMVLGCATNTIGRDVAAPSRASTIGFKDSSASTFDGLCKVTSAYAPSFRSSSAAVFAPSIRSRNISNESIMMLPILSILSSETPSASRFSSASCDGVHSTSAIASVTRRLISSGIFRSPLLSPASRCTTGTQSFVPTIAHAAVGLTSPTTTIQSGRCSRQIFS